jgi:hypothetical protein
VAWLGLNGDATWLVLADGEASWLSAPRAHFSLVMSESVSRSLVNFGVLNDNFIKRLISCVKYISMFLIKV